MGIEAPKPLAAPPADGGGAPRPPAAAPREARPEDRRRASWKHRVNYWRKHSPLNPYWLEMIWLRRGMEFLAPHARGLALDIGCGERPYDELFLPRVDRYVGIEYPPSADNLVSVWDILDQLQGVIDVFADGQRLPVRDRSVDTVLALEVLEHVPDAEACLAEIDRVLKPDGRILLTVPFVAPLHQLPYDFRRFTAPGLEAQLARHGFRIVARQDRGNFSSVFGSTAAHWVLRTFGSTGVHPDGSAKMSRWRAPLLSPLVALLQLSGMACERWGDATSTLGYAVVAERA